MTADDDEQAAQSPLDQSDDNVCALAECVNATANAQGDVEAAAANLAQLSSSITGTNLSPQSRAAGAMPILVQPSIVLFNRTTPTIIVTPVSHTNLSSLHLNHSSTFEETSFTDLRVDQSDSLASESNTNASAHELFKAKIDATYPRCLVIKLSVIFLVINTAYAVLESKHRFDRSVYFVYASKIIFLSSISNIFYALLALLTGKLSSAQLILSMPGKTWTHSLAFSADSKLLPHSVDRVSPLDRLHFVTIHHVHHQHCSDTHASHTQLLHHELPPHRVPQAQLEPGLSFSRLVLFLQDPIQLHLQSEQREQKCPQPQLPFHQHPKQQLHVTHHAASRTSSACYFLFHNF